MTRQLSMALIAYLIRNHPRNEKSSKSIFHLTHLGIETEENIAGTQADFVRVTKHFTFVRYTILKLIFIYYALWRKRGLKSSGRHPISFPGRPFFSFPER